MNKSNNLPLKYVRYYDCYSRLTDADREMLSSVHIQSDTLSDIVYSIDCMYFNRIRHGVGIRNVNGGVEFINFDYMESPRTLRTSGISVVPYNNSKHSRNCCLFYSLVDYMAYKTLKTYPDITLPDGCDCLILSQCRNIIALVVESEDYDKIYTFFPNTELGGILARTFSHRNPLCVENREWQYTKYENMMEYLKHIVEQKKQGKK